MFALRVRWIVALMLAVSVSLGLVYAQDAPRTDSPAPLNIAVVDYSKVLKNYKKTDVVVAERKEKFDARNEALQKRYQELAERQKQLRGDTRSKDDPALIADLQRFQYDNVVFDKDRKELNEEVAEFNIRHMKQIIAEINEAVRRYASSKGYDLVIKMQAGTDEPRSFDEFMQQVMFNPVVFCTPRADITDKVVLLLNTAYDKGVQLVPDQTGAAPGKKK